MTEKSSAAQVVQIGVETTAGTAVAATKRLASLSITPKMEADVKVHRPAGRKFDTLTQLLAEHTTATYDGVPTFEEIIYPLSSVVDTATITTPAGGTTSRLWTFVPDPDSPDAPKTFTVEKGDSSNASRAAYGLFTGIKLSAARKELSYSGDMLLGKWAANALSGSTTALTNTPMSPASADLYIDTTYAGIGTTKVTRAFKFEPDISDKYTPVWPIGTSESFAAHVENKDMKGGASITVAADTTAAAMLTQLRDGSTGYMRYEVIGPIIEGSIHYRMTLDLAFKVSNVGEYSDEDGVYAQKFDIVIVDDSSLRGFKFEVVNKATAL